jgi:hypothetical protein
MMVVIGLCFRRVPCAWVLVRPNIHSPGPGFFFYWSGLYWGYRLIAKGFYFLTKHQAYNGVFQYQFYCV